MEINKVAIKFGDNDFHSTFFGVLSILRDAKDYDKLDLSKENLCLLINNLSPLIYVTHQNQFEYRGLQESKNNEGLLENKHFISIKSYLQISLKKLLVNEEVDKYIEEGNNIHFFNGETFIYDSSKEFNSQIFSK